MAVRVFLSYCCLVTFGDDDILTTPWSLIPFAIHAISLSNLCFLARSVIGAYRASNAHSVNYYASPWIVQLFWTVQYNFLRVCLEIIEY